MGPETVFSTVNLIAILGWILLVFAPRWKWTDRLVKIGTIPLILAFGYLILVVLFFGSAEGGFGSLAEVKKLFGNEWALLAGWIHYLAFDLFVGSWEVTDAQKHSISHWLVIPCLVLTFLLGPIGLLLYFLIRAAVRRRNAKSDD